MKRYKSLFAGILLLNRVSHHEQRGYGSSYVRVWFKPFIQRQMRIVASDCKLNHQALPERVPNRHNLRRVVGPSLNYRNVETVPCAQQGWFATHSAYHEQSVQL